MARRRALKPKAAHAVIRTGADLVAALTRARQMRRLGQLELDQIIGWADGYTGKVERFNTPYGKATLPKAFDEWLAGLNVALVLVDAPGPRHVPQAPIEDSFPLRLASEPGVSIGPPVPAERKLTPVQTLAALLLEWGRGRPDGVVERRLMFRSGPRRVRDARLLTRALRLLEREEMAEIIEISPLTYKFAPKAENLENDYRPRMKKPPIEATGGEGGETEGGSGFEAILPGFGLSLRGPVHQADFVVPEQETDGHDSGTGDGAASCLPSADGAAFGLQCCA